MKLRPVQRGAFTAPFAIMLVPILGMVGMALDLSFAYVRRTEMQALADVAALAAARALDGTVDGVGDAVTEAREVAEGTQYNFGVDVVWSDNALRFAASPDAAESDWIPAGSVTEANAPAMRYARVDTAEIAGIGQTSVLFARVLGSGATLESSARAVAGRSSVAVTPLAICALKTAPTSSRANSLGAGNEELLEYGFRRGVTYNLLNLNPNGAAAVSYLVNPVDFPPAADHAGHNSLASVRPFVCNGKLARPGLAGGASLFVTEPFPPSLADALNSRMDLYGSGDCNKTAAPPDTNVRNFAQSYPLWWMTSPNAPARASALEHTVGGALLTIGESATTVAGTSSASYGTLWSYAKPVRFSATAAGNIGANFINTDMDELYPVASGSIASGYSNTSARPYKSGSWHRLAPTNPGLLDRRVLNIPLLACPVSGSTATVLAVGRFLMVAPATESPAAVHAEFGGLATLATADATASLYR